VSVARHQCEVMFQCDGGDPDVVFWDGVTFDAQGAFDSAVQACGFDTAAQYGGFKDQVLDTFQVFLGAL